MKPRINYGNILKMASSKYALTLLIWIAFGMLTSGCGFFSNSAAERDAGYQPLSAAAAAASAAAAEPAGQLGEAAAALMFQEGYAFFRDNDYEAAATVLYAYMQAASQDHADYQWATFFLGVSLKRLGYSQAASDLLARLVARNPNPKIVTYCLEMFESMSRTQPVDREMIIDEVLCSRTFGFLEGRLADFVNYHQGLYDWQHGYYAWGDDHFRRIAEDSEYYFEYRYQSALRHVHADDIDAAMADLKFILRSPASGEGLKYKARKNLARLFYERGEYDAADQLYTMMEKGVLNQSETLLERAWAQYRMGNAERAMGLLYAFEAPSFEIYFTPEYYLLKSFIYKDVCHYRRALTVVDDFRRRYQAALDHIYTRGDMTENSGMLLLLLRKDHIRRTWRLLNLVTAENATLDRFAEEGGDPDLIDFLRRLYDLQIAESREKLRQQMTVAYEAYADELLKYEEEANLMAYEIGLDMYQRVNQFHYTEKDATVGAVDRKIVIYPFQHEFWDDELSDYRVKLPNKCQSAEEWDIFFK